MFLTSLKLSSFRNHVETSVDFHTKVTCITGNNGTGKTNLLDAVYFLCLTKSNLYATDQQSIRFGSDFLRLEGVFNKKDTAEKVVCKFQAGKRKEFLVNETPYTKISEHIGQYPCMMISPADAEIILGGSEERRKVIDGTLSQTDSSYLELLMQYNKLLTQRNAALKQFVEQGKTDAALLYTYDARLIPIGTQLYEKRKQAIASFQPLFEETYAQVSLNRDKVALQYTSQLTQKPFETLLKDGLQKDLILQRTDTGIHKDDIELLIEGVSAKRFGSQGQQKTLLIALKMALLRYIKLQKGFAPILLVDDIFDKLDKDRSNALIELLTGEHTGQVILSHTKQEDLTNHNDIIVVGIKDIINKNLQVID